MDWTIQFDKAVEQYLPDLKVVREEPMSRHTTFRIGGPAKRMAYPASREDVEDVRERYRLYLLTPPKKRHHRLNMEEIVEKAEKARG